MRTFGLILAFSAVAMAGAIAPDLQHQLALAGDDDLLPVFVLVQGGLDDSWIGSVTAGMTRAERQAFVVDALQDIAGVSQAGVLDELGRWDEGSVSGIQSHWLANAVYCEASPALITALAARTDVVLVESAADPEAGLIEPVDRHPATGEELDKAIVWSVTKINADDVWALGYDGTGVVVGVIDTGTDYEHTDLANQMWDDGSGHCGYDFYDDDWDPMDDYGHGTHVSGSVLGDGTGGTQTGVAPGAQCMALRINYYYGGENTWVEAMEFGTENGAAVLTMSLGSTHGNTTLRNAEASLLTAGVFHSVAAGNDGPGIGTVLSSGDAPPPWFHPQQTQHGGQTAVVTVGATDSNDTVASFSSRGPVTWWPDYTVAAPLIDPDISGPGVGVISTSWGGGYESMDGTSMATPHVAGVAALMLDANPNLTVSQIDQIMEQTALDLLPAGKDNATGSGRIDALAAVQAAIAVGVETALEPVVAPGLAMSAVYPNPVGETALFEIYTGEAGRVEIEVFDLSGRIVAGSTLGEVEAGTHAFGWTVPSDLGNGIYFIRSTVGSVSDTARMTVVR
ncbi:MAG: S8 family peptidase [Candidatus Fermentibacter sp.]|nr:S8 family peptidase [Candidatus Fermentibacter sp.]